VFTPCEHFLSPHLATHSQALYLSPMGDMAPDVLQRAIFAFLVLIAMYRKPQSLEAENEALREALRDQERRNKVVHRWLREERERYEGIRSAPGRAEAELASMQCAIVRALEP